MGTHKLGIDLLFERLEEEALEKGREVGRASGMCQLLLVMLQRKFGEDETRAARIATLDEAALQAASVLLLEVDDEDAFWREIEDART